MPANVTHPAPDLGQCLRRMERMVAMRSALKMKDDQVPYVQPLLDAVGLFEHLKIPYALIGGVAAMYYGRARFTDDLDFVATTGHMDVLARHPQVMEQFRFDPNCTYRLYHASGVEIDIWKDEHSDGIISRSRDAELAGRKVRIADPHDLIAMKLRAGRLQDDYDISEIIQGTPIDEAVLSQRTDEAQMTQYRAIRARAGLQ